MEEDKGQKEANPSNKEELFEDPNKFKKILKRVDEAQRDHQLEVAKKLDFFEEPQYFQNARKDIEMYFLSVFK